MRFDPNERRDYEAQDEKARKKRSLLVNQYGLTPEPFGVFMREVARLSKSGDDGAKQAGFYLSAFSKRRQLLAKARGKLAMIADLAPAIRAADRTIVFTQTVEAALSEALARHGEGARVAVIPEGPYVLPTVLGELRPLGNA